MRIRASAVILSLTIIAAAAASEPARTSSAYARLTASSAAACARACADDGICMAWSYFPEHECRLSAVVPARLDDEALAAGFAARAPRFLQPAQTPIAETQIVNAHQDIEPRLSVEAEAAAPPPLEPLQTELVLLGGPDEDDLRQRRH